MDYIVEGKHYNFSYQELRGKYYELCQLKDKAFLKRLPEALHLACFICYLKETPTYLCLSDEGIIHQLIHLLHIPKEPVIDIKEIRKLFEQQLLLAP